ncbi:LysM peptidoglycan-binding domain-containing protein [uncultured Jatrophihabitans sp.]|uniref:LysM peptidoglycan-binding domain-containing protein n=1 Tax=uncultured Jatrophihabitans sp. TaxID=1610747 RepID=UPI0035CB81B5
MSVATEFSTEFADSFAAPRAEPARAPRLRAVPDLAPSGRGVPAGRPAPVGLPAPAGRGSIAVLHRPSAPDLAAPLRLTRRGVVVIAALVLAAGAAVLWLAARSAAGDGAAAPSPAVHRVVVQSGDTLWSIASRVAPQRDPRAEVADLEKANHLANVDLVPGQALRVP